MSGRNKEYHLKEEMRRLSDKLDELIDLYKGDQPRMALSAVREMRMLAALGLELEGPGGGNAMLALQANPLLSLAHQKKIDQAINKRKRPLPIDAVFEEVPREVKPNGNEA